MGAQDRPPNPDILDQVVNCFDTAVNASDIPNQSQVTQSQSPTTNHLSAQAHLCSLQRLHWRSCATVGQGSFRPHADANEFGAKRELRKDPSAFNDKWTRSQTQWLKNAYKTLKPSGRMLVMIGDGANVNALRSTVDVADASYTNSIGDPALACELYPEVDSDRV